MLQTISYFFYQLMRTIFAKPDIISAYHIIYCSTMASFGKKLREARELKGLSQAELARKINAHHSIIGRYERDEVKPTIDVVKKLADILNVTAGYLLGETDNDSLFKDPVMLKRFQEITALNEEDKKCLLANVDAFLRDAKTRQAYASK